MFQVTDANGHSKSVSLLDLADEIQKQTGFDPIVEFCAGSGINGFSVSDINAILTQIQNQFSSMTFTQLAVVEANNPLEVSGQLTAADQSALGQLGSILNGSTPSLTQVVTSTPGGLDPNTPAFVTPAAVSQVQTAQSNVSNLNSNIDSNLTTIQNGVHTIQAIQTAIDGGHTDTTGVPANVVQDLQNLQNAQAALNAITTNPANAALSTFAANLSTGLTTVLNAGVIDGTAWGSYDGIMTGAKYYAGAQGTSLLSLPVYFQPSNDPVNGNQLLGDLTSLATGVQNAFGSAFQAALAASPNGTVDASDPVFTGPSGNLESFSDVLNELQNGLPSDFTNWNKQYGLGFDISTYFHNAFGGGVPLSFSVSSVNSLTQTLSTATWSDPNSIWHALQRDDDSGPNIGAALNYYNSVASLSGTPQRCSAGVNPDDANNPCLLYTSPSPRD